MSKKDKMRFSKKIIIFTMACTVIYAIAYMVLCYRIGQLPDYSFNAGIFAALTAENGFNAWIKTCEKAGTAITANEPNEEHELPMETEDEEDSFIPYEQEEEGDSDNG